MSVTIVQIQFDSNSSNAQIYWNSSDIFGQQYEKAHCKYSQKTQNSASNISGDAIQLNQFWALFNVRCCDRMFYSLQLYCTNINNSTINLCLSSCRLPLQHQLSILFLIRFSFSTLQFICVTIL